MSAVQSTSESALTPAKSPLPLRFDLEVPSDGHVEIQLPFPAGSHVTVYVVEHQRSELGGLTAASESSTDFWDNPEDDEDWNNA